MPHSAVISDTSIGNRHRECDGRSSPHETMDHSMRSSKAQTGRSRRTSEPSVAYVSVQRTSRTTSSVTSPEHDGMLCASLICRPNPTPSSHSIRSPKNSYSMELEVTPQFQEGGILPDHLLQPNAASIHSLSISISRHMARNRRELCEAFISFVRARLRICLWLKPARRF